MNIYYITIFLVGCKAWCYWQKGRPARLCHLPQRQDGHSRVISRPPCRCLDRDLLLETSSAVKGKVPRYVRRVEPSRAARTEIIKYPPAFWETLTTMMEVPPRRRDQVGGAA